MYMIYMASRVYNEATAALQLYANYNSQHALMAYSLLGLVVFVVLLGD